jgi:hypothetical protein
VLAARVGDRATKRKESIALGLQAAAERERLAALMRSNTDRTSSGTPEPLVDPGAPESSPVPTAPSMATGQTSAALTLEHPERARGLRFAIVGGVVGASVAVLLLLGLLGSQRSTSRTAPGLTIHRPPAPALGVPPLAAQRPAVDDPVTQPAAPSAGTASAAGPAPSASAAASASAGSTAVVPTAPRQAWPTSRPAPAAVTGRRTRVNDGF